MAVELGVEAEGRAVVAGPEVGEARLEAEVGVVDLELERVAEVLGVGQAGLDGQDAEVARLARKSAGRGRSRGSASA